MRTLEEEVAALCLHTGYYISRVDLLLSCRELEVKGLFYVNAIYV